MMSFDETDPNEPPVKFGRKAQAWLRRRIQGALFTAAPGGFVDVNKVTWDQAAVDILLDWFLSQAPRYVRWIDADAWRGRGFAAGEWGFDQKAVARDWPAGSAHVDQTIDAKNVTSLDDWLAADSGGTLYYRGAAGGMALVPAALRAGKSRSDACETSGRVCPCGSRFIPTRRNARHCESCKARRRTERQTARGKDR